LTRDARLSGSHSPGPFRTRAALCHDTIFEHVVAFAILSALMTLEGRSFYAVLMRSLALFHHELR
jgi:hypothetical protein